MQCIGKVAHQLDADMIVRWPVDLQHSHMPVNPNRNVADVGGHGDPLLVDRQLADRRRLHVVQHRAGGGRLHLVEVRRRGGHVRPPAGRRLEDDLLGDEHPSTFLWESEPRRIPRTAALVVGCTAGFCAVLGASGGERRVPPSEYAARQGARGPDFSANAREPPRLGGPCCCRSRSRCPAPGRRPSADRARRASGCRSPGRTGRRARRPSCRG